MVEHLSTYFWYLYTFSKDDVFSSVRKRCWVLELGLEFRVSGNTFSRQPCFRASVIGIGTHLFVKVPRPRYSEGTFFRSSSRAATCYYQSNQSKVEAISLSTLPKDTTSELASLSPR